MDYSLLVVIEFVESVSSSFKGQKKRKLSGNISESSQKELAVALNDTFTDPRKLRTSVKLDTELNSFYSKNKAKSQS